MDGFFATAEMQHRGALEELTRRQQRLDLSALQAAGPKAGRARYLRERQRLLRGPSTLSDGALEDRAASSVQPVTRSS